MKKSNEKKIGEKLRLLGIFSNKEKVNISDFQDIFGNDVEAVQNELLQCTTVGYYPYSPLELIDVEIRNENIEVHIPISVTKAINLNIQEWLKLREILLKEKQNNPQSPLKDLDSILKKIEKIIPSSHYQDFYTLKETISSAIIEKRVVHFSYQKRGKYLGERSVLPIFLFEDTSHYLAGYCLKSKLLKTFRLDGMVNLMHTDKKLEYPFNNFDKSKFIEKFKEFKTQSASTSELASIYIHKSAYFNLSRMIRFHSKEKGSGEFLDYFLVQTPVVEEAWFLEIIKSFGKSVIIQFPVSLRDSFLQSLDSIQIPTLST